MKRKAENELLLWKNATKRKPLLIFGARQVGKTWLMKEFGKANFKNVAYINFEKEKSLSSLFEQDYNPKRIIQILQIHTGIQITAKETLLVLDEIQEAHGGLTALKYFNEDMPQLHVIAAGSLLGITLKSRTSFPVGKVEFIYLHPLNFAEFMEATGNKALKDLIINKDWDLIKTFREKYVQLLKQYYFVGGMPEAVNSFIQSEDYTAVRKVHSDILNAYQQDFAKHAPNEIIPRIRLIWQNVVSQLSRENKKFVYGLIKEGARAKDYEMALAWLQDYGLIHKVYRTNKISFPLNAYTDLKAFKLYVSDVGLLGAMANLSSKVLIENEKLFTEFKGALTEQFVMQQLISGDQLNLHYWANDSGSAEIDFIVETGNHIMPLEVKASENLQSKSLKTFALKHPEIHCYRASLSDYRVESWLTNIPLYALDALKVK